MGSGNDVKRSLVFLASLVFDIAPPLLLYHSLTVSLFPPPPLPLSEELTTTRKASGKNTDVSCENVCCF